MLPAPVASSNTLKLLGSSKVPPAIFKTALSFILIFTGVVELTNCLPPDNPCPIPL